jgi:predicted CoA-substrate-specific enzyme activase
MILIDNGVVTDYAMNSLCAAGTGAFLSSQAKRLGLEIEKLSDMAVRSRSPTKLAARCTVFAKSDMIHKAQTGHSKEDLVAGLCRAVARNYLNNVAKGKRIRAPIVFQGGVSKNKGVWKAFEAELAEEICVDPDSHLMGAVGAAILSGKSESKGPFDFGVTEMEFQTRAGECGGCANHCEIIRFYRDGRLLEHWGGRCDKTKNL